MDYTTSMKEPFNKYDMNLFRGLILAGQICFALNVIAFVVLKFTSPESIEGSKLWQTFAPVFAGAASISFISLILYNGVRSIGSHEGKQTFGSQAWFVMKRVGLYFYLPSILLTALIFLIAYIFTR